MLQLQEHQKMLSIELQARNERLKDDDKGIQFLAMLPETRNGKRNEKRERYEKRCLEVSHIRNEERENTIFKVKAYKFFE